MLFFLMWFYNVNLLTKSHTGFATRCNDRAAPQGGMFAL